MRKQALQKFERMGLARLSVRNSVEQGDLSGNEVNHEVVDR